MTLTTHATAAAAIAFFTPEHALLGCLLSFGSHFILDAIPHYDYHLYSHDYNHGGLGLRLATSKKLLLDFGRVGGDAALGLLISTALGFYLNASPLYFLLCALFACLPDFLQFVYGLKPLPGLTFIQTWHTKIHSSQKIATPLLGFAQQFVINILIIISLISYHS
jgi:hypothetical protein